MGIEVFHVISCDKKTHMQDNNGSTKLIYTNNQLIT